MRKIISLFQRNYDGDKLVRNEVVPGAEWVIAGEGVATRKWDGTCCKIEGGKLYKRYDAKNGKKPPEGFIPAQDPDPITGHWPGWLLVGDGPNDQWHREATENSNPAEMEDGTYELVGPKLQGNPEGFQHHFLIRHGEEVVLHAPRSFEAIKEFMKDFPHEGIVWHRGNGDMVKIKRKDFWK